MGNDIQDTLVLSTSYEYVDEQIMLEGSKGGEEKPHTPVETPNNLLSIAYAKVLVAVGEGELAGTPTGKDIYLNGTPLIGPNNESNFGGVTWEWRSGTQDQTYIQGMPEVSNEVTVNFDLKQTTPWVRQITKKNLSAARITVSIPALYQQMQNGDTNGYSVSYDIEVSTDGGPYVLYESVTTTGKTNTNYEKTHRVNLPRNPQVGWSLRVVRKTANSQSSLIQDQTIIKSYTEVVDAKQSYPNTALLFVQFDSRLFGAGNIPKISVKTKGRIVRVPDNYDPITRTYIGVWSGVFKWAWTDNPAWVFFDLCTNNRFGLGNRITTEQVSKWELYEVAQYCDVMVDDGTGAGTKQPRHTCNIYIQQVEDAWTVLRDICSIFNGMTYWNGTEFIAIADKPEPTDNIPIFSRSNVVNGFDYPSTDERSIYTSALISYDDPLDHYNTQVEAAWERSEIVRWKGDRQVKLNAIGCTVRAEAQRKGKYTLLTNMLNRQVVFQTGLQGLDHKVHPGCIIGVADPLISGKPFTGRILAGTKRVITLDRPTEAKAGDKLFLSQKDGSQQGRTISAVSGNVITVTTDYTNLPQKDAVWYLEASDLKNQLFKVTKITNPSVGVFEISGVEYNESKFAAIDNGARLEPRPISKVPPSFILPPSPITVTAKTFIEQTMAVTTMTASWSAVDNAVLYEGEFRVGQGDWVQLGVTGAQEFNVKGIYTGTYVVRVRSINAMGVKSIWKLSAATVLNGKTGFPPAVTSLTTKPLLFGMGLSWTFPPKAEDTLRTEFRYGQTNVFASSIPLGDFAYPINTHEIHGLAAGKKLYFWCRLIDRSGNAGPWFPTQTQAGVQGQSQINDNGQYNEYFADTISKTALDKELYDRIELIDGNGPGSVNERLDDAVSDLEEQIGNITDALAYDPSKAYAIGDIVRLGQKLYQAKQVVPVGVTPPNVAYWTDVGTILTTVNNLAAQVEVNTTDIGVIDGKLTSTVTSLESMQAAYRDDDGVGSQDDAVVGWDSRAQITTERKARADAETAFASQLFIIKAEVGDNNAQIRTLEQTSATNSSALSQRIDSLSASVITDDAKLNAQITSEQIARVEGDTALGERIDVVSASFNTELVKTNAAISTEQNARVTADSALGQRIDTVQVEVGDQSASIQEVKTAQITADGKINTSWTLKMEQQADGKYVAAGIGLGIENGPAGLQSQFLVRADRFAVVSGTGSTSLAPFVVENGQVFISQALIGNGWITNAMIGNVIQSNDFVSGQTGWRLDKSGTFEINGSVAGSGRMVITNKSIIVYDQNGTKRVQLGDLT